MVKRDWSGTRDAKEALRPSVEKILEDKLADNARETARLTRIKELLDKNPEISELLNLMRSVNI